MPERLHLYQKKSECCGCEACVNVCPKGIIKMVADSEGFLYPHIINPEICIKCKKCERVCPVKNSEEVTGFQERAVAGYSNDQNEIKASASGGLATAVAKGFLTSTNGVVYGVAYTDDFEGVEYGRASTEEELNAFRTSKYVQSRKNDVYKQVKKDLLSGKKVLFFGLPCETYALQLFLGKKEENLYICSLMCHGPSSPEVHKQYIKHLDDNCLDPIQFFSVRYKKDGWKPYYIKAVFKSGREHIEKFDGSLYGIAFLYFKRPSCNVCSIKRSRIHSDLTIGDYHLAAGGQFKPYNPDGVSSAFIHTEKGRYLVTIADNFYIEEIPVKNALYSEAYHRSIPARKNRSEFGRVFAESGLETACRIRSISRIEKQLRLYTILRTYGARVKRFIKGK